MVLVVMALEKNIMISASQQVQHCLDHHASCLSPQGIGGWCNVPCLGPFCRAMCILCSAMYILCYVYTVPCLGPFCKAMSGALLQGYVHDWGPSAGLCVYCSCSLLVPYPLEKWMCISAWPCVPIIVCGSSATHVSHICIRLNMQIYEAIYGHMRLYMAMPGYI